MVTLAKFKKITTEAKPKCTENVLLFRQLHCGHKTEPDLSLSEASEKKIYIGGKNFIWPLFIVAFLTQKVAQMQHVCRNDTQNRAKIRKKMHKIDTFFHVFDTFFARFGEHNKKRAARFRTALFRDKRCNTLYIDADQTRICLLF